MTPDLSLTSNAAITLPGAEGATTYVKLRDLPTGGTLRRVNATASTYPRELLIIQQERNVGRRNATRRSVVSLTERDITTLVPLENGTGGKADGLMTVTMTIVRPIGAGFGAHFTQALCLTMFGVVMSLISTAGTAVLAGEQ